MSWKFGGKKPKISPPVRAPFSKKTKSWQSKRRRKRLALLWGWGRGGEDWWKTKPHRREPKSERRGWFFWGFCFGWARKEEGRRQKERGSEREESRETESSSLGGQWEKETETESAQFWVLTKGNSREHKNESLAEKGAGSSFVYLDFQDRRGEENRK